MSEVLWPPDLIPSMQTWSGLGNAAVFTGPFSGASRTYSRPGSLMRCAITLPAMRGADRARWMGLLAQLRDRGGRILMPDFSCVLENGLPMRGSFPADELFTNHDLRNGTADWTAARCTLTAVDRVLRLTNTKASGALNFAVLQTGLTVTQYAPYALRSMISALSRSGMTNGTSMTAGNFALDRSGLVVQSEVQLATTTGQIVPGVFDTAGTVSLAGDYAELSYTSFARCLQVDGGGNLFQRSDEFDNAYWTKSDATVTANVVVAPDGTTTGDDLEENTANTIHYVSRVLTVSSSAADYCFCVAVRSGNRSFAWLEILEGTGSTSVIQYFNVSAGTVGASGSTGAQWSNRRAFAVPLGNSWTLCCLIGRKTNAATSLSFFAGAATADGTRSYTGSGAQAISLWRATAVQSSVPVRLTQSTSAAVSASTQTGSGIYVKGLPASTDGLLEIGDFVQIGAQMNRVTARLNSDAAGRGYLQCGNPFRYATNDAAGIVNTPMCKMMLATDSYDIDTGPGQFSSVTLEFVEAID